MMRIKVFASGSKGNCTYLDTHGIKLLIDVGISYPQLVQELETLNVTPHDLDGIFITHCHSDHTKGLASLVKRTNLPVYIPQEMKICLNEKIPVENMKFLEDKSILADLEINLIHTSHDVISVGYLINHNQTSFVYITDTGYINQKYKSILKNKTVYMIESNHDEKMLMNGPYPYILKQRVLSDKGHLSNHTTASLLTECVGPATKKIILAHISENNNTYELAYQTTKKAFFDHQIEIEILIAKQQKSLELIEV